MQIRAQNLLLVQLDQHILFERFLDQELIFPLRTVAPENVFRLCEGGDFAHPIEHRLVLRHCIADPFWWKYGGRGTSHETKMFSLTTNAHESKQIREEERCTGEFRAAGLVHSS